MKDLKEIKKEIQDQLSSPLIRVLDDEGISITYLAKKLKKELKAKQIKPFLGPKGEIVYTDKLDALDIQQRARIDAHKLRGDYPAEEHKITGEMITSRSPEEIEDLQKIVSKVVEEVRKRGGKPVDKSKK